MSRVIWSEEAMDDLAAVWLAADSDTRAAIVAATQQADQILKRDPENAGEGRMGTTRVLTERPLGLMVEVFADRQEVIVGQVWLIRSRPRT